MASRITSQGECNFCHQRFGAVGMGRHLESCQDRKKAVSSVRSSGRRPHGRVLRTFHIVVKGADLPMYWMHLGARTDSTLANLDRFLRDTWVECCGHLSQFTIRGVAYASMPNREFRDRSMKVRLGSALMAGTEFGYEYDFGTTTELGLKVLGVWEGVLGGKKPIEILARNYPPEIRCGACKEKDATQVCAQCIYEGERAWLCDGCSGRHECGEEMLLPVVNSPRVGMCGYTG